MTKRPSQDMHAIPGSAVAGLGTLRDTKHKTLDASLPWTKGHISVVSSDVFSLLEMLRFLQLEGPKASAYYGSYLQPTASANHLHRPTWCLLIKNAVVCRTRLELKVRFDRRAAIYWRRFCTAGALNLGGQILISISGKCLNCGN